MFKYIFSLKLNMFSSCACAVDGEGSDLMRVEPIHEKM